MCNSMFATYEGALPPPVAPRVLQIDVFMEESHKILQVQIYLEIQCF